MYGFHNDFIVIIIACISCVSFPILLNRLPFGNFTSKRGLWHGDTLSPYLFILGAEVLSRMLLKAEKGGLIHSVKVTKRAPSFTHPFFFSRMIGLVWFLYSYFDIVKQNRAINKVVKDLIFTSPKLGQLILRGFASTSRKRVESRIMCQTDLFFKTLYPL